MADKKNEIDSGWLTLKKKSTSESVKLSFLHNREYTFAKDKYTSTRADLFNSLAIAVRDRLVERWLLTQEGFHDTNPKRVYYLSMEFLIGRLLVNNALNLEIQDAVKNAMSELGLRLEDLVEEEHDAGLGNGGLGRLAACFLESMATLGIPGNGYGIRYEYGIFKQKIVNGEQVEYPDEWLKHGFAWEFIRPEYAVRVKYYGKTAKEFHDGKLSVSWTETNDVLAMPYDVPVAGYRNDVVNTLRLWSARSTEEFDLKKFNIGDYERAVYDKLTSENISKVLYPNDDYYSGRELRLKQEYFFTAASISDIVRRFKKDNANNFAIFHDKVAIQLNDTHPALAIAELMRVLVDEEHLEWKDAWETTRQTFAYTNHTVMPEALEKWSVELFGRVLPRHLEIIYEINSRFLQEVEKKFPGDQARIARMSLIERSNPDLVRMAFLCIVGSSSVNGVSVLHSELLKNFVFKDFFDMYPGKFNNKTNGVTQRRWLCEANPRLSSLISETIGTGWTKDLSKIKEIKAFSDEDGFIAAWGAVKKKNKEEFATYLKYVYGTDIDPLSIFDIQVKRIHEYKRQVLFCLYILSQYLKLKEFPNLPLVPRTFMIGGKAAPGYTMAKLIIRFVNAAAQLINNDPAIGGKIKLVFLENYQVSLAQMIFPAADLSEQISTAGTEASGTGCMKFMMNGALTIATLDGANIEMAEEAGQENLFIFGLKTPEVELLKTRGYDIKKYFEAQPILNEIFSLIRSGTFPGGADGVFEPLLQSLLTKDRFFCIADFAAYCEAQEKVSALYNDKKAWTKKSILNVAGSGKFSSDRTIREYAKEVWKVPVKQ